MPIDPISAGAVPSSLAPEFAKPTLDDGAVQSSPSGSGFGNLLEDAIGKLNQDATGADQQIQAAATGQSSDIASVVSAVEGTSVELDLAAQIRNKLVEAYQEIFRMQV